MILFGDKRVFAIEVTPLQAPTLNGHASRSLLESQTWAAWRLWVSDRNLCRHSNLDRSTVSEAIHWPVGFFADWIVRNWKELFYERAWLAVGEGRPRNARDYFDALNRKVAKLIEADMEDEPFAEQLLDERDRIAAAHALIAGSLGGVVPDVYFSRDGNHIRIAWRPSRSEHICFHAEAGEFDVSASSFFDVIKGLVGWTLERIGGLQDTDKNSQQLSRWLSVEPAVAARQALLHFTGLNGSVSSLESMLSTTLEDFLDLPEDWEAQGQMLTPSISSLSMAFRCADPSLSIKDLKSIRSSLFSLPPNADGWKALTQLSALLPASLPGLRDYEEGYTFATAVRKAIGNRDQYLDIKKLVGEHLNIPIFEKTLPDQTIDGAAVWSAERGPAILLNRNSPRTETKHGCRSVIAHELCHLLVDRREISSLAILSGPWAPPRIERRANAFAAELLLPKSGLLRFISPSVSELTDELLDEVMREFQVGSTLSMHHIANRLNIT